MAGYARRQRGGGYCGVMGEQYVLTTHVAAGGGGVSLQYRFMLSFKAEKVQHGRIIILLCVLCVTIQYVATPSPRKSVLYLAASLNRNYLHLNVINTNQRTHKLLTVF